MEITIKGTPEELKKVLQAIASSQEQPKFKSDLRINGDKVYPN
ncbi:hypothetical protein [Enterococcus sp. 2201sp1_2201st1_B8_2201SCRN_220225]